MLRYRRFDLLSSRLNVEVLSRLRQVDSGSLFQNSEGYKTTRWNIPPLGEEKQSGSITRAGDIERLGGCGDSAQHD